MTQCPHFWSADQRVMTAYAPTSMDAIPADQEVDLVGMIFRWSSMMVVDRVRQPGQNQRPLEVLAWRPSTG